MVISYNSFTVVTFVYKSSLYTFVYTILASFIVVSSFFKYEKILHMWKLILIVKNLPFDFHTHTKYVNLKSDVPSKQAFFPVAITFTIQFVCSKASFH